MRARLNAAADRWLPAGGFGRNVSVIAGGTALAQALGLASAPILTRLYHPMDFGVLQIFLSLLTVLVVVSAGRYEVAVLLPEDEQSAIEIVCVALVCVCATVMITASLVLLCRYHWFLPKSTLSLRRWLWLLPVSVAGGGLYQTISFWAMRKHQYNQIAASKFAQVGTQTLAQVGLGIGGYGVVGLLLGDALGRMMGSGRFLSQLLRDHSGELRNVQPGRMWNFASKYREYPLVSVWGALVNASGLAVPALLLAQFYGTQGTGWFALVNRVLAAPAALIGASVSQVYISSAAKLSRDNPTGLMQLFLRTSKRMLLLGLVPCTLFVLAAPFLFLVVFGVAWREAGLYARYLAPMFYLGFVSAPVTMTLVVLERQRAQLVWDLGWLCLSGISFWIPHHMGLGIRSAVICYGASMVMLYAVHLLQCYLAIQDRIRMHCVAVSMEKT